MYRRQATDQQRTLLLRVISLCALSTALVVFVANLVVGTAGKSYAADKGQSAAAEPSTQWCVMPVPTVADSNIDELVIVSPTDIWGVGAVGPWETSRTFTIHWDGSVWSVIPSPNHPTKPASFLIDVDAISSSDVWAVGWATDFSIQLNNSQPLVLHWDGLQWSIVPTPSIEWVLPGGIDAVTTNDVWVVGAVKTTIPRETLALHWDGSTWSQVATPNPGAAFNILTAVYAAGPSDVWAVGYWSNNMAIYNKAALTIHWDGNQWNNVPNPLGNDPEIGNPRFVFNVHGSSGSDVWAVGDIRSATQPYYPVETITMRWDGSSWSRVPSPAPGVEASLSGVVAISPTDAWVVGGYTSGNLSQPLILRWQNNNWVQHLGPYLGSDSAGLSGADFAIEIGVVMVGNRWNTTINQGNSLVLQYAEQCGLPPTPTPTPCTPGSFSDVPITNTFYPYVTCLVNRGIISGYPDCTFRPNNLVTRGQLSKIVSNSAGFNDPPGSQMFQDVPPGSTFYDWVQRLVSRGYIAGYACGGEGEPCGPANLPYFRSNAGATRGQLTKIVSNAAGFTHTIPPTQYTFADVIPYGAFWVFVERLLLNRPDVMSGYVCGGPGEPCDDQNRPYFRPNNPLTRGQTSKIVANTFFPGCQVTKP